MLVSSMYVDNITIIKYIQIVATVRLLRSVKNPLGYCIPFTILYDIERWVFM